MRFENFTRRNAVKKEATRLLVDVQKRYADDINHTITGCKLYNRCRTVRLTANQLMAALEANVPEHIKACETAYANAKTKLSQLLVELSQRNQ